jgi:hypothetical protein
MESQQQTTAQTTRVQTPVSFDDISLSHITFNENYRVSKGTASQLVAGLRHMSGRLVEPQNDYQRTIYPLITQFVQRIVTQYETTFLSSTDPIERCVYGTSLNGFHNDGSLRRSVSGRVNRNLTYSYAQFGQLLTLLTGRLRYITSRDASRIRRFQENNTEKTSFLKLQYDCQNFLTFLTTEVYDVWRTRLNDARTANNVVIPQRQATTQSTVTDEQPRRQRTSRFQQSQQSHQPHQPHQDTRDRKTYNRNQRPTQTTQTDEWQYTNNRRRHPHNGNTPQQAGV